MLVEFNTCNPFLKLPSSADDLLASKQVVTEQVNKFGKEILIEKIIPQAFDDALEQFSCPPNEESKRQFIVSKGESYKNVLLTRARRELSNFSDNELNAIAASYELTFDERVLQRDLTSRFQTDVINDIFVNAMVTAFFL